MTVRTGPPGPSTLGRWLDFGNWPITLHVLVGPVILLGFLLALAVATLVQFNRLSATSRLVAESSALLIDAEEFTKLVIDKETGVRGFVIAGDEQFLQPYVDARQRSGSLLNSLRATVAESPLQAARLARVGALVEEWERVVAEPMIAGARAGRDVSAIVRSGEGKRRTDLIRAEMAAFSAEVEQAQRARVYADQEQRRLVEWLLLLAPAVGLIAFGLACVVGQRVSRPVQQLAAVAQRLGEGDMSARAEVPGSNELARAAASFNAMAASLRAQDEALRLRAAEAEQARSQTQAVLDSTNEVFVHVDAEGWVRSVNRRFETMFGLPPEELLGLPWRDAAGVLSRVLSDTEPLIDDQAAATIAQHWPTSRELELVQWPVRDAAGTDLGRLYVFRDVTREREIDRMKSEFVSLVSHELRTPLTSVKGYVSLLADGSAGELTGEQAEFLAIVAEDVDRLVQLVNDLLDVSRIEAGKVALQNEEVDLAALVSDVARRFRPALESKDQRLIVEASAALPPAWADPGAVVRVLINLISNAHKYTPEGGSIAVRVAEAADRLRIEVRDTGIGLSAEEQAQLFSKFYRARNLATEEAGGTGLGLVIARGLVEAHGGQLEVASAPGDGATFAFTLPLAGGTASGVGDALAAPPAR